MTQATLLPDPTQVELVTLVGTPTGITAVVRARACRTWCPVCGALTERVHSRLSTPTQEFPDSPTESCRLVGKLRHAHHG